MEGLPTFLSSGELWSGFLGALFGGFLSLASAWLTVGRTFRKQRDLANDQQRQEAAKKAFVAFMKLKEFNEAAANLDRQIKELFDQSPDPEMEPFAKVTEMVGDRSPLDAITPDEISFLVDAKKAELMDSIFLIQKRIMNVLSAAHLYNDLRRELFSFVLQNSDEFREGEGMLLENALTGRPGQIARLKANQLNNLIGQIMEMLEADVGTSWEALNSLKDAAEEHFERIYPRLSLELADSRDGSK
jgi:hypothetical protein